MSVKFYMDVHVPRAVTTALRMRNIDVVTAQDDGAGELDDATLLRRATSQGRILVTQDADLLREGSVLQRDGVSFSGVVYGHQRSVSIGEFVKDLALIAEAGTAAEWAGRIVYLPL